MYDLNKRFTKYKKSAMITARQLNYGYDVIHRLREAKTEEEIGRIMTTERRKRLE